MDIPALLKKHGFSFSKKYGQNFITDYNLLRAIVSDAGVTRDDTALEIGAGAGTLTRALAESAGRVVAFEIDPSLSPVLDESLAGLNNVEVIMDDVTKWTDAELDDKSAVLHHHAVAVHFPRTRKQTVVRYRYGTKGSRRAYMRHPRKRRLRRALGRRRASRQGKHNPHCKTRLFHSRAERRQRGNPYRPRPRRAHRP